MSCAKMARTEHIMCLIAVLFVGFLYGQPVPYVEKYFDQLLDHFNFMSYGQKTFKQRYLIQDKWWNPGKGPIFFYTGNEGSITGFWENSGFVFDIAPQFGALVVFAEHRYYGNSLPFSNASFSQENIGLLTIEQALADYVLLLTSLKVSLNAKDCPVIAFGGSYGGMLSAYIRIKYPNVVTGAIAASAPIFLLTNDIDRSFFWQGVTKDFAMVSPDCENGVRKAFIIMNEIIKQGKPGLDKLTSIFKVCHSLQDFGDYYHLLEWIRNSFTNLAMFDYPYPTNFEAKLPAYPVNTACNYILTSADPVLGLAEAAGLFYNGTGGSLQCFDIFTEFVSCADQTGCGIGPDSLAWDYQACTEIPLVGGSTNVTDMFPEMPFTAQDREKYCQKQWNVTPRDDWSAIQFLGRELKTVSNIVFSNGDLDPWRGGGVLQPPNDDVQVVTIEGGAHHLDLRGQNPQDPISVLAAREVEKQAIRKWILS